MNLRKIRKARNLTAKELGQKVGKTESAICMYENGKREPSYDTLLLLAEVLDCSVGDIIGEKGLEDLGFTAIERVIIQKYRTLDAIGKQAVEAVLDIEATRGAEIVPVTKTKIIPLFAAAAGAGEPVSQEGFDDYEVEAESKAQFAVKISGDSMAPEFNDGDIVLCRRKRPEIGDIAVIMVNGFLLVKQYITDGMNIYLRSLNRERKNLDVDIWETGNDTVIGYGTVIHKKLPLVRQ